MGVSIELEVPASAELGAEIDVAVLVKNPGARAVDRLDLELVCELAYVVGDQSIRRKLFAEEREIEGPFDRASEPRRFVESFQLPAAAPPTFETPRFSVRYVVRARAEVLWWFDPRTRRELAVVAPTEARPAPAPARAASVNDASALFAELSVDDKNAAPGDVITGAFAVGNVRDQRLDGATVSLVASVIALGVSINETLETVFRSIVDARDGTVIEFALRVPATVATTIESDSLSLTWSLVVRIDGSSTTVMLPVHLGSYGVKSGREAQAEAAAIGAARWREGWAALAIDGLALNPKRLRLEGPLAPGVTAEVEARGARLVADLHWESWGIELELTLRHLFHRGSFELADDPLYKRFAISARCEEQVVDAITPSFVRALVPFSDIEIGDASATLGVGGAAHDLDGLGVFVGALRRLAAEIVAADRRIGAPPAAGGCGAAWTRFAASVAGRLRLGKLAVMGAELDGADLDVETRFEGAIPCGTRITLHLDPPISAEAKRTARDSPVLKPVLEAAAAVPAQHAEGNLQGGEPSVFVRQRRIVVELAGHLTEPSEVRVVVSPLVSLARSLRGQRETGPYR